LGVKKWATSASVFLLFLWFYLGIQYPARAWVNNLPQSSPFVLPIVKRDSLLNGLQLITLEQQGAGSVSAHLRINSGALFDLAGKGGLADITAGMLLKGGGGLTGKNISDTVEQLGLTVNVTTGWDSTDIIISGPADTLDSVFDLMGKLVISPTFEQKEIEPIKQARAAALSTEVQEDSIAARRKALEVVYGSHPFGRPVHGTPESIAQISRQDLIYFHNRFYIANNSQLIVTGDATSDQVTKLGRSKLGAWKKGEKVPPTFKPADPQSARRIIIIDRPEGQPAQAVVAQLGLSRRADDYFGAVVMADVLGRQISQITSVHDTTKTASDLEARLLAGPLIVSVKAAAGDLAGDLSVVLDVMSGLQANPSTNDRIEAAKTRLITAMADRLKTPAGTAEVVLDIETFGLGRDYVINFADRVNAISPADVQRAAQNYLKPNSVTIVIVGPASRFEGPMKKFGVVAVSK
jgi:zinc protease